MVCGGHAWSRVEDQCHLTVSHDPAALRTANPGGDGCALAILTASGDFWWGFTTFGGVRVAQAGAPPHTQVGWWFKLTQPVRLPLWASVCEADWFRWVDQVVREVGAGGGQCLGNERSDWGNTQAKQRGPPQPGKWRAQAVDWPTSQTHSTCQWLACRPGHTWGSRGCGGGRLVLRNQMRLLGGPEKDGAHKNGGLFRQLPSSHPEERRESN